MRYLTRWPHLLLVLLCSLLIAVPVMAQGDDEGEPAEPPVTEAADAEAAGEAEGEEGGPAGVEILVLLVGIAAVLIVGGAAIGQEAFNPDEDDAPTH